MISPDEKAKPTAEQKRDADKIGGLVVQHIEDGEVTVVDAHELLAPARAQYLLYSGVEALAAETDPGQPIT